MTNLWPTCRYSARSASGVSALNPNQADGRSLSSRLRVSAVLQFDLLLFRETTNYERILRRTGVLSDRTFEQNSSLQITDSNTEIFFAHLGLCA